MAKANNKTHLPKARAKERMRANQNTRKTSRSPDRTTAGAKTRTVSHTESATESKTTGVLRRSLSCQRARHPRCFEDLVAEAGISCMCCCHQWHHVEEAVYCWIPELRWVLNMGSHQAPRVPWPTVWLVGKHKAKHPVRSRELMELGHFCQAIRDTLKQLEMAGDAWSERVGHAECRKQAQQEHRAVHKIARSRS